MSIIKVENLSKKYIIGHDKAANRAYHYYSLRESLMHHARGVYQRLRHPLTPNRENTELEEFWALKDINFEIKQGDRVGIIGRNGAGKSTLLKILSRITEPTTGKINMKGRVASLLEVGTGFHPELTGRENIYLNGAVLGMTRLEIKKKFDEIVAFAEIEKFLDTPVKRYSSGMYVRLAFAVAAHLEPEILLVDEVLAVGDAEFQKKCLGKMEDVSKEGRTVLFVSHNMAAIQRLCSRGVLLKNGVIVFNGKTDDCIDNYLNSFFSSNSANYLNDDPEARKDVNIASIKIVNVTSNVIGTYPYDEPFHILINIIFNKDLANLYLSLHIHGVGLNTVIFSRDFESNVDLLNKREKGKYEIDLEIPAFDLVPGKYSISLHVCSTLEEKFYDRVDNVCPFEVVDKGSIRAQMGFPWHGEIATNLFWKYNQIT